MDKDTPAGIMIVREPCTLPAVRVHGLAAKVARVMAQVDRIPKRGKNQHHGYEYATEADITDGVRRIMAQEYLVLYSEVESAEQMRDDLWRVVVRHELVDAETGESREWLAIGLGQDRQDKGIWKALTGCVKYALLKTFLVSTGDDPEATDRDGRDTSQSRQSRGQQRAPRQSGQSGQDRGQQQAQPDPAAPADSRTLGRIKYLLTKRDPDRNQSPGAYLARTNEWLTHHRQPAIQTMEALRADLAAQFLQALERPAAGQPDQQTDEPNPTTGG